MHTHSPIRVLIADDHAITREGLAALLSTKDQFEVAGLASDGSEAVELYRKLRPDVTLMDLSMPRMDGIEAIRQICKEDPRARILVLTAMAGEDNIYSAVRAGAKGYLLKDTTSGDLVDAIVSANRGLANFPTDVMAKLTHRMTEPTLTHREMEVLNCMTAGKSNQETAQTLYICEGTVKSHVNSILSKLHVNDRTQAVTTALRRGLVKLA